MGGLDARHMLVYFPEMSNRIASVTTIGTPHLGSSVAEWLLANADVGVEGLGLLIDNRGLQDLTRSACQAFNSRAAPIEARNSVQYQSTSLVMVSSTENGAWAF